jgi:hypothetical protein
MRLVCIEKSPYTILVLYQQYLPSVLLACLFKLYDTSTQLTLTAEQSQSHRPSSLIISVPKFMPTDVLPSSSMLFIWSTSNRVSPKNSELISFIPNSNSLSPAAYFLALTLLIKLHKKRIPSSSVL